MEYDTLKEYLYAEKKEILKNCIKCSQCIEVCPNLRAFNLDKDQVQSLPQKLLDTLLGAELSDPVFQWVFGCNHCGCCLSACPEGLNPLLFNIILKREILLGGDKRVSMIHNYLCSPASGFKRTIDIIQHLLLKPSEIRWLTQVPHNPEPVETVLLIGCTGIFRPDITLSLLDIMDMIGISYIVLGGINFCCGSPFQLIGDIDDFEMHLRNLFKNLLALNPDLVLYACAECLYNATHVAPHIIDIPFKQESAVKFVADNMGKLPLEEPQPVKISFHDSCSLGRLCEDYQSPRKILNHIPGTELVEMQHIKQDSPCCGALSEMFCPGKNNGLKKMRIEEFQQTGAKQLITTCVGCESTYRKWKRDEHLEVTNIFSFLGKSLGIGRQNPFEPFYHSQDVEGILEKFKHNIAASIYTEDEYRTIVAQFLGIKTQNKRT